jgi:hypothetical protein
MRHDQFEKAKSIADEAGIPLLKLGKTGSHTFSGKTFSVSLNDAHIAYMDTLSKTLS